MKNFYIILGVSSTADFEEIKAAYRTLAKKYHPDKNAGDRSAEERFKEIQEAYTVLSNPEKRRKYDQRFFHGFSQKRQSYQQPYTGNAYQYAQQQAQQKQRQTSYQAPRGNVKPERSENYYILLSVGVAMILLYFIISYSSDTSEPVVPAATRNIPEKESSVSLPEEPAIHDFDSPYVNFFGEEVADLASKNSITINNASGKEAVVCLVGNEAPNRIIRNQYMNAGSTFKMNAIPDGDYFLRIYYGNFWDTAKTFGIAGLKGGFAKDLGFLEVNAGKNVFRMKQENAGNSVSYSSYEIDLYPYRDSLARSIGVKEFFRRPD